MKKTKMQEAYDLAFEYEKEWKFCSQCTIKALMDVYKIDNDSFFKALSGFAAGGGLEGDGMCGAYLAGIFFLGLKFGRGLSDIGTDPEDPRGSKKNRRLATFVKKLHEKFIEEYGTVTCSQIHRKLYGRPFYIVDPDESKKFEEAGAHTWGCTSVCGNAARWTVEIFDSIQDDDKNNP
ncbi:MAG: C_GCAxxG_C_C family protein [Actinobacteria bacterium]|nr:C_GCAxxG_C_C family protein [Actinomycetota bacterium]